MGVHSWNAWVPAGRVPRFCIRIPNPAFLSKPFFFTKLCVPALPCSNFASRSCIAFLNGKLFEFLKQVWCDASAWWLSQSPAHNGRTWTASPPGGPARESPVDPCSWSRAGSSDRRGAGSPRGSTCRSAASPRFERGRTFVALVRPGGAVRALFVGKQVKLVGKLGRAHVTLVGLAAQMDLLVHLHAGQVGETFVTEGAGKQLFQWRIFPLPSTASPTMLPFLFDIVVTTFWRRRLFLLIVVVFLVIVIIAAALLFGAAAVPLAMMALEV